MMRSTPRHSPPIRMRPRPRICTPERKGSQLNSLAAIVDDYCQNVRPRSAEELAFYADLDPAKAIEFISFARWFNGKRHPHQYRITRAALRKAFSRLRKCNFNKCRSFDEVFALVQREIGGIHGIGELTVYDTAYRLGAFCGLEPEEVYFHAGTRDGARALGLNGDALEVSDFPSVFAKLLAREIEDCLCIYADQIAKLQLGRKR